MPLRKYTSAEKETWFQYYVSLGEKRSLKAVADYFKVPLRTVSYASQEGQWSKRIRLLEKELEAKVKQNFQEHLDKNLSRYLEDIYDFEKIIQFSLSHCLNSKQKIPIKNTRDLKNIVDAFKALVELELRIKEGKAEDVSIIIAQDLLPKIEQALMPLQKEKEHFN